MDILTLLPKVGMCAIGIALGCFFLAMYITGWLLLITGLFETIKVTIKGHPCDDRRTVGSWFAGLIFTFALLCFVLGYVGLTANIIKANTPFTKVTDQFTK